MISAIFLITIAYYIISILIHKILNWKIILFLSITCIIILLIYSNYGPTINVTRHIMTNQRAVAYVENYHDEETENQQSESVNNFEEIHRRIITKDENDDNKAELIKYKINVKDFIQNKLKTRFYRCTDKCGIDYMTQDKKVGIFVKTNDNSHKIYHGMKIYEIPFGKDDIWISELIDD